jgi:hypothetical protein
LHGLALLVVAVFTVAAVSLTAFAPLHDHLCFMARADCARTGCDVSHDAWGHASFHTMGLLLAFVPTGMESMQWLGVGLTAVALLVVYGLTIQLSRRTRGAAPGPEAGLWALVAVCAHPAVSRLAGGATFWPPSLVFLLGSASLLLASRERDSRLELGGAAALFALAMGGNRMLLVLGPLALLAPLLWPPSKRRWPTGSELSMLIPIAYIGLQSAFEYVNGGYSYTGEPTRNRLLGGWRVVAQGTALTVESFTAWPVTALVVVGLLMPFVSRSAANGESPSRASGIPLAYATVSLVVLPSFVVGPPLWKAYPDIYIKHFPALVVMGCAAGLACSMLIARLRSRNLQIAGRLLLLSTLVGWSMTRSDALSLARSSRVMEREIAMLDRIVPELPPHDVLMFGPTSPPLAAGDLIGDPFKMHFPVLHWERTSGAQAVVRADYEGEIGERTLAYIGSVQRSFSPGEIARGAVPATLVRPEVARLRERYDLVPARTFELSTEQPEVLQIKLGAGRVDRLEVGFYWVRPKAGDAIAPGG